MSKGKKILGLLATGAIGAAGLVLAGNDVASAAKVANPGPVSFAFDAGSLTIGSETFETGGGGDQVVASGTVAANGNVTLSSLSFPPIPPVDGPLGEVDISIQFHGGSGNVNPLTGAANLQFSITVHADGTGLGSNCRIPNITVNASTSASGGVAYNPANGSVTLADHSFSVPGATGCTTFPVNVNDEINDQLGLPSPSGQNHATFSGASSPILGRAIVPSFTVSPASGPAPVTVSFDASATFHTRPITSYQWDFDNDGTFDQTTAGPTTSTHYATPGTRTIRLRVTDADGDSAQTTRTFTTNPAPNVVVDKTGAPNVVAGDTTAFELLVTNVGTAGTGGTTTVVDSLPAGFAFASSSGTGWACAPSGQDVVCESEEDVAGGGGTFPALTINATANAGEGIYTNSATVDTDGESPEAAGSSDTYDIEVLAAGIDLQLTKVHDPDSGLFVGETATYVLSVDNVGTSTAEERVTVVDTLPAGVQYVSAAGGLDWVCFHAAGTVTCISDEDVPASGSLEDIRIVVELTPDVVSPVSNSATVSVDGDPVAANDTDTDTGDVLGYEVDYDIFKSQLGPFVVGEPGLYGLGVKNVGTAAGGGTVTVEDELPAGITYVGASAEGWTCGAVDQLVTCTHPGGVEAGDFLPGISLQVAVGATAVPSVTNTATVSAAGDADLSNNAAELVSPVRLPEPDLTIAKTHPGNFTTLTDGTYTLTVTNLALERADGPTTVVDTLPAGLTFVSAGGTGWSCDATALPAVTCTYADPIAGLSSAPPISLVVNPVDGAAGIVTNVASVANAQDVDPGNDGVIDPTRIEARAGIATTLEADAIVLRVALTPRLSISLLNAPYAVLRAGTTPVPGKVVTFRAGNGNVLCSATTDAQGAATCGNGLQTYLATLGSLRYTATFAGDFDHAGSTGEASVIHLQGLRAP